MWYDLHLMSVLTSVLWFGIHQNMVPSPVWLPWHLWIVVDLTPWAKHSHYWTPLPSCGEHFLISVKSRKRSFVVHLKVHWITLLNITLLFIIVFYKGWVQCIVHFIAEVSLSSWLVHVGQNVGFSFFLLQIWINTSMFLTFMSPFSNSVFSPVREGACPWVGLLCPTCVYFAGLCVIK
jgi:hypothetical protein